MEGIIVGLLIALAPPLVIMWCTKWDDDRLMKGLVTFCFSAIAGGVVGFVIIYLGSGLMPGYSSGDRMGFITKASTKGIFFVTNEVEMQMGTGQQSAIQEPHPFSVPDRKLFDEIQSHLGEKCKVQYRQWLVMPVRVGESNYEVVAVEWLKP